MNTVLALCLFLQSGAPKRTADWIRDFEVADPDPAGGSPSTKSQSARPSQDSQP
jgi:hypothetical protein